MVHPWKRLEDSTDETLRFKSCRTLIPKLVGVENKNIPITNWFSGLGVHYSLGMSYVMSRWCWWDQPRSGIIVRVTNGATTNITVARWVTNACICRTPF
ncbi:Uncharacterized protein HZ326_23953 [Fusarium oxysporum f. sp. albedinis]|nr:Uncharacterized protein HZ326_23953 [Fusarium oxysporum f. sp. albedinis]